MPSTEHNAVVEVLRSVAAPPGTDRPLADARAELDAMATFFPLDADVVVSPVTAAGVASEWIDPPGARADRVLLYLHGGSFTAGSLTSHRSLSARLGRACGTRVLGVDYRLAPEHPHPAALDDAVAAYRWLLAEGFEPGGVVIAGDSAGGGLAAATLLVLRDGGDPLPAGAVLLSPWLDLTLSGDSMKTVADDDPVLDPAGLARNAERYAGALDPSSPLISPLFARLEGLPPLLVLASTADVLVDDARRFAVAAEGAAVDITLVVEPELIHVWPVLAGVPEAEDAVARIGEWMSGRMSILG